jgi:uncharacterized membrane protein
MNKFKRELIILSILLLIASAISMYFYVKISEVGIDKVPIHWNINNEPNHFASPLVAGLFGPATIILMMIASFNLSRKNFSKSEKRSSGFVILLVASFLVFINWIALKAALGYASNEGLDASMFHLALGLMFILIGNQFGKLPYSRWIGVRVPATLNNEEVWNRVHRKSGRWMVVSGMFVTSSIFLGDRPGVVFFYIPLFVSLILMIFVLPPLEKKSVEEGN